MSQNPRKAYLTIDDSPSADTGRLGAFLAENDIPALLFCRGDRLAEYPEAVVQAVQSGLVLANHCYSHQRASALELADVKDEIWRTEKRLDDIYRRAGQPRPFKAFRFPHMDRGAGGWIVDYEAAGPHKQALMRLFGDGLNIDLSVPPAPEQLEKKRALQEFLRAEGFTAPFTGITHEWYAKTEMAQAVDAMFTFSTSDWMITARHQGKWPYRSLDDLKAKIDDDPDLALTDSAHIILAHDQPELCDIVIALIQHMQDQDFKFLEY